MLLDAIVEIVVSEGYLDARVGAVAQRKPSPKRFRHWSVPSENVQR